MAELEGLLVDDVLPPSDGGGIVMKCDLCNVSHTTGNLLCETCADMVHRVMVVNDCMNTHEMCAAERLAAKESTDASNTSMTMPYWR